MPLLIFLVMVSKPLIAQTPTNPQLDGNLIVVNDNSIKGTNLPFYPKIATYASLNAFDTILEASLIAEKYGLNEKRFLKLIYCESTFDENAIGDNGKAFGLLQFHKPTFNQYCEGDYYNMNDQLNCAAKMIKNGLSYKWSCVY